VNDGCIAQSKKLSPAEFHDFAGFEMGTGGFILNPHSKLLFTLRMLITSVVYGSLIVCIEN